MTYVTFDRSTYYPVLRDFQSRFGFLLDTKASLQRDLRRLLKKPFEAEFSLIAAISDCDGQFLDVGANRGQSIDAIRLFKPDASIIAFEPNGLLVEKLTRRFANEKFVSIISAGLSDQSGSGELFVPFYRQFMYDGLASFDYEEARNWLNEKTVWRFKSRRLQVRSVPCELKVMDDLNLMPAFVKIDVQGFEKSVLMGGQVTLETHKPLIILENNPDAGDWLRAKGWVSYAFQQGRLERAEFGPNNTVFLHPDSALAAKVLKDFS